MIPQTPLKLGPTLCTSSDTIDAPPIRQSLQMTSGGPSWWSILSLGTFSPARTDVNICQLLTMVRCLCFSKKEIHPSEPSHSVPVGYFLDAGSHHSSIPTVLEYYTRVLGVQLYEDLRVTQRVGRRLLGAPFVWP